MVNEYYKKLVHSLTKSASWGEIRKSSSHNDDRLKKNLNIKRPDGLCNGLKPFFIRVTRESEHENGSHRPPASINSSRFRLQFWTSSIFNLLP